MSQRPYDWGRRPPSRIDWAWVRFAVAYPVTFAVVAHYLAGVVR